jgi:antirestriction protein ArdC
MKTEKLTYNDFVKNIANQIKEKISNGAGDWVDNFNRDGNFNLPINSKGKHYKGVNILALLFAQLKHNFKSSEWMTFKQIKENDGMVNKGEKSQVVFFFSPFEKKNKDTGLREKKFFAKQYRVFNLSQTTLKETAENIVINGDLQNVIDAHNPEIISHDIGKACYIPSLDVIKMPLAKYFETDSQYMATLAHEFSHWTMHEKRLNRDVNFKCQKSIAKEELIAELSNSILLKHFGISSEVQNHASYIGSWMHDLTENDFCEAVKQSVKVISFLLDVEASGEYQKIA